MSTLLERIAAKARDDRKAKFSSIAHYLTPETILASLRRIPPSSAMGVDGISKDQALESFSEWSEEMIKGIFNRGYQAPPVKRVYIPKPGRKDQRPIGIPTIADRALQKATAEVLNPIFEQNFLVSSFGGRPKVGAHNAICTLCDIFCNRKVNWAYEADLKNFFGSLSHEWAMKFMGHRVSDPRILNLIRRWLKAGVLEEGAVSESSVGTPQGGPISVLISNLYLHYVLDIWFDRIVKPHMKGEVHIIRYLDDFIVCFQYHSDAKRFEAVLPKRLAKFGLKLEPSKTRLVRFGRFAKRDDAIANKKTATLYFLGFTLYCSKTMKGKFKVGIITERKRRARTKLKIKELLLRNRHLPIPIQHKRICQVLRGMFNYYGLGGNHRSILTLRRFTEVFWRKSLSKRSQKGRYTWKRYEKTLKYFPLPAARLYLPYSQFPSKSLLQIIG